MKTTDTLSANILKVFEGNNWTEVSVSGVLSGISFQQANTVTAASKNTIAGLAHHLLYWNNVIMQRMQGEDPSIPDSNGFDVGELTSEEEWQKLVAKLHQSFIDLSNTMRNFPEDRLKDFTKIGKSTIENNLYGIIEHAYYHLGQMMILKNLLMSKQVN